jgi:hypothetical protein
MLGQVGRAYFDRALDDVAASIPELTELPSFRALRKSIKRWTRVIGSRNDLSHVAGSVFSYLNVEFRADKDADGNPQTGVTQTMWLRRTLEVDGTTLSDCFESALEPLSRTASPACRSATTSGSAVRSTCTTTRG